MTHKTRSPSNSVRLSAAGGLVVGCTQSVLVTYLKTRRSAKAQDAGRFLEWAFATRELGQAFTKGLRRWYEYYYPVRRGGK